MKARPYLTPLQPIIHLPYKYMKEAFFLSQRLGFSNAQAATLQKIGVSSFLKNSFDTPNQIEMPAFMEGAAKNKEEFRAMKKEAETDKTLLLAERARTRKLAVLWTEKMYTDSYPLREKMTLFWHNHFVTDAQKVKVSWAIWQQNTLFREFAFGNYKTLTLRILYDNAMLMYLDNTQNRVKNPNENLSRELLELFTLGTGNYSEADIKAGARALAGLSVGDDGGKYYPRLGDDESKTYLGKTGNWKAADMVDLIFQHPKAGNRLMEKFLKAFMTDAPTIPLVEEYGTAFRKANFEMKPMLEKLVRDDRFLKSQGAMIKDPISFLLGTLYELQMDMPPAGALLSYSKGQGMSLLFPPNVKGWDGGRSWLSAQKLLQRTNAVAVLLSGRPFERSKAKVNKEEDPNEMESMTMEERPNKNKAGQKPVARWNKSLTTNKLIIGALMDKLVFAVSPDLQMECEQVLKYDFDPNAENAAQSVLRLVEHIMKSPEYQIV